VPDFCVATSVAGSVGKIVVLWGHDPAGVVRRDLLQPLRVAGVPRRRPRPRGRPDCGCGYADDADNAFAQIAYDYTFTHTSAEFAAWMRTLPTEHRERTDGVDMHWVHGSPLALNDFWWDSLEERDHRMRVDASGADVVCWYALLDLSDGAATAELVPLDYDWAAHAASIRAAELPEAFATTVETGWWETCLEIVPPVERSWGKFQLYKSAIPAFDGDGTSWGEAPGIPDDDRPVMPLFGSALFPPRLWVYTNFHCNLACAYCSVASSPQARPRSLGRERFTALVDDAVAEGFTELYVTGGEPFLEPDLVDMLLDATERLDVVCLTNAMLYRGRRREQLERLAGRPRLTLQTSLDGAEPATHDVLRGAGSWRRAMEGLDVAVSLDLPVRVGMHNAGQGDALRTLLTDHGVPPERVAVRPLVARGHSDAGIGPDDTVPELTATTDGWHWHPAGADLATSPDMHLGGPEMTMAEARRRVVERFLTFRQRDGSLPLIYQCAV